MFSSSLPPEVILIILSFLPGKTLPKLRLLSKQFNSIISEPYFLHLHHRFSLNSFSILTAFTSLRSSLTVELQLFLFTKPKDTSRAALNALAAFRTSLTVVPNHKHPVTKRFLGDRVRVFSSNHQFLCFVSDKEHFLFDPINQKTLELPKSSSFSSPNVISFGFVSSTLQYKIIRFFLPYNPICKFEVLTISITGKNYKHHLEISPWKSQEQQCPYLLQPYPPVHANGFIYWTTKHVPKIVSFSLEQEKFSLLPPPPCFEENPNHDFSLCGIRGNLWVIDYNSLEPSMEIWMMNGSNGSAWVKTHRIGLKETLNRYYPSFPIRIHEIQSDLVLFQVLFPSRINLYYRSKNEVVDFGELNQELQFSHYTDGLLSL
ncbi:unnamed protein product [Arabis nemorensis]|uniref:F-box domain-containing protein n=1 Tax=Arabis nemorensis TaxID=586526 RepID=A0A565BPH8_9BRAS|nr:unnamed protein product [Arabis nemorensis]